MFARLGMKLPVSVSSGVHLLQMHETLLSISILRSLPRNFG